MRKKKYVKVLLPVTSPSVSLSPQPAKVLQLIIRAGHQGINSLQLFDEGCISAQNNISKLKKIGAMFETQRKDVIDSKGTTHKRVAYYKYLGWDNRLYQSTEESKTGAAI